MSGQKQGSLILRSGLNEVYNTGVYPNFALKYFMPVYDSRIDLEIHDLPLTTATAAIQTSASVLNVDTVSSLFNSDDIDGEYLFNLDNLAPTLKYRIDYDGNIVTNVTADPTGTTTANTTMNSKSASVNYIYNTATSTNIGRPAIGDPDSASLEHYAADNVVYNGSGGFSATQNFTQVPAANTIPASISSSLLFDSVDYISNEGNDDDYGVYQVRLPAAVGSFKFNKIVLFGQKVDTAGNDIPGEAPFAFAVVALNNTHIKLSSEDPNNSNNVTEFIADITIAFTRSVSGASEITYNPEEYWSRIKTTSDGTTALEYPGSVLISPINSGVNEASPKSKLHIIEDDTQQSIIRFSRQESSNLNDGHISINPETSSIQIYSDDLTTGYEFGSTTSAVGAHSISRGSNLNMLNSSYTTLIGKDVTLYPSPPDTPSFIVATNFAQPINSFGSYVMAQSVDCAGTASIVDSLFITNDPFDQQHTSYQIFNSLVNNNIPNLSSIKYTTAVASVVSCTTSGSLGIRSSLTIGSNNNYDDVYQSIHVGDDTSLLGPINSSIIVGETFTRSDPVFAGPGLLQMDGCISVTNSNPQSVQYNMSYKSLFAMGDGHIIGGGLQPTSAASIEYSFISGFGCMVSCDYSFVYGENNILNAAPTQIDHSVDYKHNYALGFGNVQNGVHTATTSHNFNKGIFTLGARNYTEDCKGVFVLGGQWEGGSYASDSDNDNNIRRAVESFVFGHTNTILTAKGAYQHGNNLSVSDSSSSSHQIGAACSILNDSTNIFQSGNSLTCSENSFDVHQIGTAQTFSKVYNAYGIGNAHIATGCDSIFLLGDTNSLLGAIDTNQNITNSVVIGHSNSVLNKSNRTYMFGHQNSILGSLTVTQPLDSYLVGSENNIQAGVTHGYAFGHNNVVSQSLSETAEHNYLSGRNNTSNESTNVYVFGNSQTVTSAVGAFLIGNGQNIDVLNNGGTAIDNYMIGQANDIETGAGTINNSYVFGVSNNLDTNSSQQDGYLNANFVIGQSNSITAHGGSSPQPQVANSSVIGVVNKIFTHEYTDTFNSMVIGDTNTLEVYGATADTVYTGIQVIGSQLKVTGVVGVHDLSVRQERACTILGSYGDTEDLAAVTKVFKVWDNAIGGVSGPNITFKENTDAIYNSVTDSCNLIIANGISNNPTLAANAMAFGTRDIGNVGLNEFRQFIILPIKMDTRLQATNNPLNPGSPDMAMPSIQELTAMKLSSRRAPMGTICYDQTETGDSTPLLVWTS